MKNVFFGLLLAGLVAPASAAQVESNPAETLNPDPVNLKPMVVTPQSSAIESISRAIVAQMLKDERWKLPRLVAPDTAKVG